MTRRLRGLPAPAVALLLAALLVGCAAPRPPAAPAPPAAAPTARLALQSGDLELRVHRDGPLARLGHNHVITSSALQGWAAPDLDRGAAAFRIELPVASLVVDDAARRAAAGEEFAGAVPDGDRAGTRRNLLGPAVLDAARYPALVASGSVAWPLPPRAEVRLALELRGARHELAVPVQVEPAGAGWRLRSDFVVSHAAIGLVPFSVAMGAVRVRDDIRVRLDLRFGDAPDGAGS